MLGFWGILTWPNSRDNFHESGPIPVKKVQTIYARFSLCTCHFSFLYRYFSLLKRRIRTLKIVEFCMMKSLNLKQEVWIFLVAHHPLEGLTL